MLGAFFSTVLFSISAVSGRRLSTYLSGTHANLMRLLLVAIVLGSSLYLLGIEIKKSAFPLLFLSGCVGFGIGDLSMFQAYPCIGTRRTTVIIQCLAAPFAAGIEWAWLNHSPTLPQAAFGTLILIGVGVAIMPRKSEAQPIHSLVGGIAFATMAAVCQALGAVLSRKAYAVAADSGEIFQGVSGGINATFQRSLGGVLICALTFIYLKLAHRPDATKKANWSAAWPWLIGNGLTGPTLGVICYQWALSTAPTNIVLPLVATTPLVVLPVAHFLEGDLITRRAIFGSFLAVAGVIGLTHSR